MSTEITTISSFNVLFHQNFVELGITDAMLFYTTVWSKTSLYSVEFTKLTGILGQIESNNMKCRLSSWVIKTWKKFQKKLDAEAKRLHTNAQEFSKQTHNWHNLVDGFNGKLKELGNIEYW